MTDEEWLRRLDEANFEAFSPEPEQPSHSSILWALGLITAYSLCLLVYLVVVG